MALTDAQMTDVRRYAGYPLTGTTMPITDDQDIVYQAFGMVTMSLHRRLTSLSASEEAVLVSYLTNIASLEAAILTAGDNLDTDKAAVWTRNRTEMTDRLALFNQWCLRMCSFLGLPPGPGLGSGGNSGRLVRS